MSLMEIERLKTVLTETPISAIAIASLRESARLLSTHFSTQIEGNRLTLQEVRTVVHLGSALPGRERDEVEVRNHYRALEFLEGRLRQSGPLSILDIQRLHSCVMNGVPSSSPFRDGQNVIRNSIDGSIAYLPPEASDVPSLMVELIEWINQEITRAEIPVPVIAALAHYEFATIHPYYDGNGRTARLLALFVLYGRGYHAQGIFSLEEYYARDLQSYYRALDTGPGHNYYQGRATADVSGFIEYFCVGMATALSSIRDRVVSSITQDHATTLSVQSLHPMQRRVLGILAHQSVVTSGEIAKYLGINPRQSRSLCSQWVKSGFLKIADPSKKSRSYTLR